MNNVEVVYEVSTLRVELVVVSVVISIFSDCCFRIKAVKVRSVSFDKKSIFGCYLGILSREGELEFWKK